MGFTFFDLIIIFLFFFLLFGFCSAHFWAGRTIEKRRRCAILSNGWVRFFFMLCYVVLCGWCRRLQCNFCKAQQKCSTTSDNRKLDEHYGCWDKPQLPLTESKSERKRGRPMGRDRESGRWDGSWAKRGTCHIAQWCPGNWQLATGGAARPAKHTK